MNLDQLLTDNLRPVPAPPDLWARVVLPAEEVRESSSLGRRLAWCLTAAVVVLIAVWGFHARGADYQPVLATAPHCVEFLRMRVAGPQSVEMAFAVGSVVASVRSPRSSGPPAPGMYRLSFSGGDSRACLSCHVALN
jgi:hypothetical protein